MGHWGVPMCASGRLCDRRFPRRFRSAWHSASSTSGLHPMGRTFPRGRLGRHHFCKLGLVELPTDWLELWRRMRDELREQANPCPEWVAVVYLDWEAARAPHPEAIVDAVTEMPECRAVLFDTWAKSSGVRLDRSWQPRFQKARDCGRMVALAGSMDVAAIARWKAWQPDVFAIRGAACAGGDRLGPIDTARVARLAEAVRSGEVPGENATGGLVQMSNRTP